jgi:hypothetical protein
MPIAERHFAESNAKKRPQWHRQAHAHAWAGVMEAIAALDAATASPAGANGTGPGMNEKASAQ